MGKSTMPLRLSQALIDAAAAQARGEHRSVIAQIEHWAMIGRIVERGLTAADVDLLAAGLGRVRVERRQVTMPELAGVMAEVDRQREDGTLAHAVLGPVTYRVSDQDPDAIDMVTADGRVFPGRFVDGRFVADPHGASPSPGPAAAAGRSR